MSRQSVLSLINVNRTTADQLSSLRSWTLNENRCAGDAAIKEIPLKFYLTHSRLLITQAEIVACKPLRQGDETALIQRHEATFDLDLCLVTAHPSPVTCLGIADEGWLLCSCSEEKVVLSKQDALLKTFSSATVAVDMGRILGCAVTIRGDRIMTCLAKVNELVIIESTSTDSPLTEFGLLDLSHIEITASYDRINEPFTWLQLVFFHDVLHVIGMATRNLVSLKIWEVSTEGIFKLKDHRMASLSKAIAGIDFVQSEAEEYSLVIVSPEGHCELFAIAASGFCLLTRLKLDDFLPSEVMSSVDTNGNSEIDFQVLSARFRSENRKSEVIDPESSADDPEALDNSLTLFEKRQVVCPQISIFVVTTKGVQVVNLRSGETQLAQRYDEFVPDDAITNLVFGSAKMLIIHGSSSVLLALQPCSAQSVYTFQVNVEMGEELANDAFTLSTTKEVELKSVLRKRLKSPPPQPLPTAPPKRRPPNSRLSQAFRRSSSVGTSFRTPVRNSFGGPLAKSQLSLTAPRKSSCLKSTATTTVLRRNGPSGSGTDTESPPVSARSVPIKALMYSGHGDLNFEDCARNGGTCLPTRLSILSHMRMCFSVGGKEMAVGGNVAPLIIFRTHPNFQRLCLLKDSRRVTALQFSFNSNQHLLIATNDGKTEIVNWRQEKQLLALQFSSKFNEHAHAQFYYLDRFILQPEDNRIALYSFRIQEPSSASLKAGSFKVDSQQITALSAPNQFYSSTILYGGSNKCLAAFDASTEQEIVSIPNAHSKPISLIRINETPKGLGALFLCDLFLTAANTHSDPIKIWDLRIAKCVTRIGDVGSKGFVPTSRPALSPCGKYIASGFEENVIGIYDIRKANAKVATLKGIRSSALDCAFDLNFGMLWAGSRDGNVWNLSTN